MWVCTYVGVYVGVYVYNSDSSMRRVTKPINMTETLPYHIPAYVYMYAY